MDAFLNSLPDPLRRALFTFILRPIRKLLWILEKSCQQFSRVSRFLDLHYNLFLNRYFLADTLTKDELASLKGLHKYFYFLKHRVEKIAYQPKISIIVPVYKVEERFFREMLQTIAVQVYENWELCICDDASNDPRITAAIDEFKGRFPGKVKSAVNELNQHISVTSNRCLEMATGDYVALLDHDDRLLPNAFAEMVRFIDIHDQPDILYSDERVVDEKGLHPTSPFYKPAWSPFLHLSVNFTTHLSMYRKSLVDQVGGFRKGFEGSQDHDLMLRLSEVTQKPIVHVPFCLYQWRATATSTAKSHDNKSYAAEAGIKAVKEACERRGWKAEVEWEPETVHYRVKFDLPATKPLISLVIPTKDGLEYLPQCIASIQQKTTYPNYEIIIVDNGSELQETRDYLKRIQEQNSGKVRVIHDGNPFNFAELNNRGAKEAKGEFLVLLNNDTTIITPNWLEEMLRYAQFDHVGAVGCKLLYEDDTVQHGGVVLIDRAIGGHAFRHLDHDTNYYYNLCHTVHETSAVTAACMMIRRQYYWDVDGLDEIFVPNGYGDVDFCLKLKQQKKLTHVYTPYASLYHLESKTRGAEVENFERNYMIEKWGLQLMNDPYLNVNLARGEHYSMDNVFSYAIDPSQSMFKALLERPEFKPGQKLGAIPSGAQTAAATGK